MNILFLPKWYPHKFDEFEGNFIDNHAMAVRHFARVEVLFVHSEPKKSNTFDVIQNENNDIGETRVFFKKPTTKFNVLNKIITFCRYYKAQKIGYKKIYKSTQPDVVHVHVLTRSAILALLLQFKKNIPFVITEHWSGYLKENGMYKGFLKEMATRFVVKKAQKVTVVSNRLKEAMLSHQLKNEYVRIPNVVDTTIFKVKTSITQPKKEILYVGNLLQDPKKIFDIIHSMNVLKDKNIDFHLRIFGEGKDEEASKQLVNELKLQSNITFCGTTDRKGIAEAMVSSDFLILFSAYENQPCVLNEAWSCGIPVIVPEISGIMEWMQPQLGLTVPIGDQGAFVVALEKMVATVQNYDAGSIRNYAEKYFSEKAVGEQFMAIYYSCLKT